VNKYEKAALHHLLKMYRQTYETIAGSTSNRYQNAVFIEHAIAENRTNVTNEFGSEGLARFEELTNELRELFDPEPIMDELRKTFLVLTFEPHSRLFLQFGDKEFFATFMGYKRNIKTWRKTESGEYEEVIASMGITVQHQDGEIDVAYDDIATLDKF
jgi:hypothetical protein